MAKTFNFLAVCACADACIHVLMVQVFFVGRRALVARCTHASFSLSESIWFEALWDDLGLVINLEAMIILDKAGLIMSHPASHLTGYLYIINLTRTGKDVPVNWKVQGKLCINGRPQTRASCPFLCELWSWFKGCLWEWLQWWFILVLWAHQLYQTETLAHVCPGGRWHAYSLDHTMHVIFISRWGKWCTKLSIILPMHARGHETPAWIPGEWFTSASFLFLFPFWKFEERVLVLVTYVVCKQLMKWSWHKE
jgi:hypothetical protein